MRHLPLLVASLAIAVLPAAQSGKRPVTDPSVPMDVSFDELTDHPDRYIGQAVTISARVSSVIGPRLFTVDGDEWLDFDRGGLVFVPPPSIAAVRDGRRIVVTGRVRPLDYQDVADQWGWIAPRPRLTEMVDRRPLIEATKLSMNGSSVLLSPPPAGTSGRAARATGELKVGDTLAVANARVVALAPAVGFWITGSPNSLFVLPEHHGSRPPIGSVVSAKGTLLELPSTMRTRIGDAPAAEDADLYLFAWTVRGR